MGSCVMSDDSLGPYSSTRYDIRHNMFMYALVLHSYCWHVDYVLPVGISDDDVLPDTS